MVSADRLFEFGDLLMKAGKALHALFDALEFRSLSLKLAPQASQLIVGAGTDVGDTHTRECTVFCGSALGAVAT